VIGFAVNWAIAELPLESVQVTTCIPAVAAGIANVTPEGSAPVAVAVVVATPFPSNSTLIIELDTKFDPVTVTVAPTCPLVGFSVIDGIVTVKVSVSELPPASVAMTVLTPLVDAGTVHIAENEPEASVVTVAG